MVLDFRRFILYNILPRNRMLIAFTGFFLSSIIISGSTVLLSSMLLATQDYLGETDDIIIISNPEAATPFTSTLPLDIAEATRAVPGVLAVSPEVIAAAVYENKAVYLRGVDTSTFWDMTSIVSLRGSLIDLDDHYGITIGANFARTEGLDIGSLITVFSTRTSSALELKVKSIITTHSLLDDVIIAPLWIGQFLAFETYDYISHLRVRIDPSLTNRDLLTDIVTGHHQLTVSLSSYNATITRYNASLIVQTVAGRKVLTTPFIDNSSIVLSLPFREYVLTVDMGGIFSDTYSIILATDRTVDIFLPYIQREITIRTLSDEDEPIGGRRVQFRNYDQDESFSSHVYQVYTDELGFATLSLPNGTYVATTDFANITTSHIFTTSFNQSYFEFIVFYKHPILHARNFVNNSLIIGDSITFDVACSSGYDIFYYHGNEYPSVSTYYKYDRRSSPYPLTLPFSPGEHNITFYAFNNFFTGNRSVHYAELRLFFTVLPSIPTDSPFLSFMNGSHLLPGTALTINSSYSFGSPLYYRWFATDDFILVSNYSFLAPDLRGIYRLDFSLSPLSNSSIIGSFFFVVDPSEVLVGTFGSSSNVYSDNASIPVWHHFNVTHKYYSWDSGPLIPFTGSSLPTTGLSDGAHTLSLFVVKDYDSFLRTYTIQILSSSPSLNLTYNDVLVTNDTLLPSAGYLSYSLSPFVDSVYFSWDGLPFSRSYGSVPIPILDGNYTLSLKIIDQAGNIALSSYSLTVTNSTSGSSFDFFLSHEYTGLLSSSSITLNLISSSSLSSSFYSLVGPVSRSGLISGSLTLHLYPGTYSLSITSSTSTTNRVRSWSFTVLDTFNSSTFTFDSLYENSLLFSSPLASASPVTPTSHFNSNSHLTSNNDPFLYFPYFDFYLFSNDSSPFHLSDSSYSTFLSSDSPFPSSVSSATPFFFSVDTVLPDLTILSPHRYSDKTSVYISLFSSSAVEIYFYLPSMDTTYRYNSSAILLTTPSGLNRIDFYVYDSAFNLFFYSYEFYTGQSFLTVSLHFQDDLGGGITDLKFFPFTISSEANSTVSSFSTNSFGQKSFKVFSCSYTVHFNFSGEFYSFTFDPSVSLTETIFLGKSYHSLFLVDEFTHAPLAWNYFVIRDSKGICYIDVSDSTGYATIFLEFGHYTLTYLRGLDTFEYSFSLTSINQTLLIPILSFRYLVTLEFEFSNGRPAYSLTFDIFTKHYSYYNISTGNSAVFSFFMSYGLFTVRIHLDDSSLLTIERSFAPGREFHTLIVPSVADSALDLLPPTRFVSDFSIFVSLSADFFEYYLRGSLLFTYTLIYALVTLILLVVFINMYTIVRNVFLENRKDIRIVSIIGGTNFFVLSSVFLRLVGLAIIAGALGYFVGTALLQLLAYFNQTSFFGHNFYPQATFPSFLFTMALIVFSSFVTTIPLVYNLKEKISKIERFKQQVL